MFPEIFPFGKRNRDHVLAYHFGLVPLNSITIIAGFPGIAADPKEGRDEGQDATGGRRTRSDNASEFPFFDFLLRSIRGFRLG